MRTRPYSCSPDGRFASDWASGYKQAMGAAIGEVLSFGVGVALSPIPIIGVVLMPCCC